MSEPTAQLLSTAELEAGLDLIRQSPKNNGPLDMIVRRPQIGERQLLTEGTLDPSCGLVGDNWSARSTSGAPNPDMQLTVMNSRAAALVAARDKTRWPLAGDQIYLDLDLSEENLPPGTRLSLGAAIIQISHQPHTGCKKFLARFGQDAMQFVNSPVGRQFRLRGLNARILQPGLIRLGDLARKLS